MATSSGSDEKHVIATSGSQRDEKITRQATAHISEMVVVAEGEERTTIFVWLLVCISSISGLLFGKSWL